MVIPEPATDILEFKKCTDPECDVCSAEDSNYCLLCSYPYRLEVEVGTKDSTTASKHSSFSLQNGKCIDCTMPDLKADSPCKNLSLFDKKPVALNETLLNEFSVDQRVLKISLVPDDRVDVGFFDKVKTYVQENEFDNNHLLLMLRFWFTKNKDPDLNELSTKTYLNIVRATGHVEGPYFILEASQNQFIDPKFKYLQVEYYKPCLFI